MANTSSPFGFRRIGVSNASAPNFALTKRRIASGNATAIYYGDPVMPVVSSATGYITAAVAGTTTLAGVFYGCEYLSVSQKRKVWSNYWPGSDANGDVTAYLCDDPNAKFEVQSSGAGFVWGGTTTTMTSSVIGQYVQINMGSGSATTGVSGAYVVSPATTVTLPFIVLDYVLDPPGVNGIDPTTQYCNVIVGFNNEILRSNGAGPTGIA